jgi:formylglycine-generating enzyme required for sulfatase activity
MICRKLGTEVICDDRVAISQSPAANAAVDIALGIGDTLWGAIQFPNHVLKYITGVDEKLGQDRAWRFSNLGRSYSWNLTGNPLYRTVDTAAHVFYGAINTLTAGGAYTIFNEKLGLGIEYFTPPPQNLREMAQVFSGGLLVAAPLKGVALKALKIKAPPAIEVTSHPTQVSNISSATKVSAQAGKIKATTTVETPPTQSPPPMGHPMEGSPFRRQYEPPQGPFPTRNIHGYEEVKLPERACVVGSFDFPENPPHWTVSPEQWVSKAPVTEGQFHDVTGRRGNTRNSLDHPVTEVDWNNSAEYCQRAGVQLLTSAQSESAMRGPAVKVVKENIDGRVATPEHFAKRVEGLENFVTSLEIGARIYTATDPALHQHLNKGLPAYAWPKYPTRSGLPEPEWTQRNRRIALADSNPTNGWGLRGFGNVWEWNKDFYKPIKPWPLWVQRWLPWLEREGKDFYRPRTIDPQGPVEGQYGSRVVRGGSWIYDLLVIFRAAFRDDFGRPVYHGDGRGFRVGRVVLRQDSKK